MIAELVKFRIPEGMTRAEVLEVARGTYAGWRAHPELLRKHYLIDEAQGVGGGFYLWTSRAAAEAAHDATFRARVRERFGSEPEFTYFDLQALVDNESGSVTEY